MYRELKDRLPFGHRHTFLGDVYHGLTDRLPFVHRHTIWDDIWDEIDRDRALTFFGGVGLGLGLMFLFDPARGSHRRARIRNAAVYSMHKTGDAIGAISRTQRERDGRMGERVDLH